MIQKAAILETGRRALYALAVIGAFNAAIAAFYYVRVLKTMVIDEAEGEQAPLPLATIDRVFVAFFLLANVLPILGWSFFEGWAQQSLALYAGG